MPLVENRYAKALIDVSLDKGSIDALYNDLNDFVGIYESQSDLKFFLLNPEIKTDIKKDTIKKILSGKVSEQLLNFILLLLDKGRIKFLPGILEQYVKLADKFKNILSMTIISSSPLEEKQIKVIEEKYKTIYKSSSVKSTLKIDTELLGGLRIEIGDKIYDGSLKGRLNDLKSLLITR